MSIRAFHLIPIIFIVLFIGSRMTCREIPVDRVGVKQNVIGGGVVQKDYQPGYCFIIPGMHRLYLMDPTLQDYTMAGEPSQQYEQAQRRYISSEPVAKFRTGQPISLRMQDEFTVDVDITVLYRIKSGKAHRILTEFGTAFHSILQQQTRKVIYEILAKLQTSDFYNAKLRASQAELARAELNKALDKYNLEVLQVLIRNVEFQKEFEQELVNRQLMEQRNRLATDRLQLALAKAETAKIERATTATVQSIAANREKEIKTLVATTDLEIARILADAQLTAQKETAEADSYKRQQIAQGDLERTSATALGDKAMAAAYSRPGGEFFLARQMIDNLEIGDIEINTNETNPFDVKQMLGLIGLDLSPYLSRPSPGQVGTAEAVRP